MVRALGFDDAGCIATGQRADLLLYDCPDAVRERPAAFGATEFLVLIACKRPSGVLTEGQWMTGAIRFAC
ncbi:hypothetical protein CY652_14030 [Burkholderia sp. WAC0059]|uniref:hypothetical protein n=1 Tax=Burkholderia sp. WAC0059 TaxID=2066022 RepID=UPI000C7F2DF9|nr:hypothetical protein [Burkholderia sp. WAC0059]PLZ01788.1 hypothetical protein CY652_14030 [Burkholderia sp. WAC0059]